MITKIYIENELVDLFEDETIELNVSIANTDDITKVNSDYTKTFTVPASDRNNRIFKHYYNADIDNTFDARTKKNARIELDGLPFKVGKIRLEKVSVKSGLPSSYTINFWGNLVNFKTLLKDDELSSLDFTIYDHEQTSDNVRQGLESGLFGGDVIYPLLYKKQLYYDPSGDNTNGEKIANIAYDGGSNTGLIWNELRPAIGLLPLIELIESKYGFAFTRDFFGRDEFKGLYLWVNDDKELNYFTVKEVQIDFTSTGNIPDLGNEINLVNNYYIANGTLSQLYVKIIPSSGYENVTYTLNRHLDGEYWSGYANLTGTQNKLFRTDKDPKKHTFFVSSRSEFKFTTVLTVVPLLGGGTKSATQAEQTIPGNISSLKSMPKIKIVDFIKGLINMFNLVLIPNDDGSIYVNTKDDYYREGALYDFTKYVDNESFEVSRGTIKNVISFKYQEPQTILNKQFKINTTIAYGDEEVFLKDDAGELLDGDTLEVQLPFEQILYERLTDLGTDLLSNIQYGSIIDENLERVNPKPVIFYNNLTQLGSNRVGFKNDVGGRELLNTTMNMPSHNLGFVDPSYSLTFGLEYSTWDYQAVSGTLYNNYWANFVSSIFNIKRRNYKYTSFLPTNIITKLQLNDLIFIRDRYYRINDYNVNLITGETTLNIINTFENNFGLFQPSQSQVYLNYKSQSYTVYVSNGSVMNISLTDTGFGTSWATAIQNGTTIVITVTENAAEINRDLFIDVDNGAGKSFQIYLNQDNKVVTADDTFNTADSTILTADAE